MNEYKINKWKNDETLHADNIESSRNLKGEKSVTWRGHFRFIIIFVVKWFVDCLTVDSIR